MKDHEWTQISPELGLVDLAQKSGSERVIWWPRQLIKWEDW